MKELPDPSRIKILLGHTSPETAYIVDDYPYGFRLRCKIRYWLDCAPKKGARLMSQTTNPKRGDVWNKPKASTYCRFAGAMYLDEQGHVQWSGVTEYMVTAEINQWLGVFAIGVPEVLRPVINGWVKAKVKAQQLAAEGKIIMSIGGERHAINPENI